MEYLYVNLQRNHCQIRKEYEKKHSVKVQFVFQRNDKLLFTIRTEPPTDLDFTRLDKLLGKISAQFCYV